MCNYSILLFNACTRNCNILFVKFYTRKYSILFVISLHAMIVHYLPISVHTILCTVLFLISEHASTYLVPASILCIKYLRVQYNVCHVPTSIVHYVSNTYEYSTSCIKYLRVQYIMCQFMYRRVHYEYMRVQFTMCQFTYKEVQYIRCQIIYMRIQYTCQLMYMREEYIMYNCCSYTVVSIPVHASIVHYMSVSVHAGIVHYLLIPEKTTTLRYVRHFDRSSTGCKADMRSVIVAHGKPL